MPEKSLEELRTRIGESHVTVENLAIEAGKVQEFATALRDDNPVFHDESVASERSHTQRPAPLTFTRTRAFPRYVPDGMDFFDLGFELGFERKHSLHGEQRYEFERPVEVGDVLTGTTTLVDVYERDGRRGGTMTFAVLETEFHDRNGDLVLTSTMTRIETDGGANDD